jgi:hypothetical protein
MYIWFSLLWYCNVIQIFILCVLKITNMVMEQSVHVCHYFDAEFSFLIDLGM